MITTRGVEKVAKSRAVRFVHRLVGIISPVFNLVVRLLPGVRSRLAGSLGGRTGELNRLMENKQFPDAFKCALDGMTYCEAQRSSLEMHNLYWWIFMENAALIAGELGERRESR